MLLTRAEWQEVVDELDKFNNSDAAHVWRVWLREQDLYHKRVFDDPTRTPDPDMGQLARQLGERRGIAYAILSLGELRRHAAAKARKE